PCNWNSRECELPSVGAGNQTHQIAGRKNSLVAVQSSTSAKIKVPVPQPVVPVKKDKRQNSSRFNASNNRELQKLPSLKESLLLGEECYFRALPAPNGSGFCLFVVCPGLVFPYIGCHLTLLN
uniref:Uncharacterized protein n=1 Tax=Peromyscus maniculatus bairdii TaxID=230844 RepID=A0A8C8ULY7_PERMB